MNRRRRRLARFFNVIIPMIMACVITCLFQVTKVSADNSIPSDYRQIIYNQDNGLGSTEVNCLYQTKSGYIWVGTDGGLYRYGGKEFKIYKFRTMCLDAEDKLSELQEQNEMDGPVFKIRDDPRITKVGKFLRKTNIDELPQMFNIFKGDMSFVGPRPQSVEFVKHFDKASRAVFLMPAGITSETTLNFLNESEMLKGAEDIDDAYIKEILPVKMNMQLEEISKFSMINDLKTMIHTLKR